MAIGSDALKSNDTLELMLSRVPGNASTSTFPFASSGRFSTVTVLLTGRGEFLSNVQGIPEESRGYVGGMDSNHRPMP